MKIKFLFLTLFIISAIWQEAIAQGGDKDTVWVRNLWPDEITQTKFSNNGNIIVAGGMTLSYFYDTKTGNEIKRIEGNGKILFTNDDSFIIQESGTIFNKINVNTLEKTNPIENPDKINNDFDLSIDNKYMIASFNNGLKIWDFQTGKIIKTKIIDKSQYNEPKLINVNIYTIKFVNDNNLIIANVEKRYQGAKPTDIIIRNCINLYDSNTLDSIYNIGIFDASDFIVSNTCKYIAIKIWASDNGVKIYDLNTKQLLRTLPTNGANLTGMKFTPDDKYLVVSHGPGANVINVWDIETGKVTYTYENSSFMTLDISSDGKYFLTSVGRILKLYNAKYNINDINEKDNNSTNIIYPNPNTGEINLEFFMDNSGQTNIELYNSAGELINTLFNNYLIQGDQKFTFNVNFLAQGSYFIRISNPDIKLNYKLIIVK